jgi:hypothetical protein
MAVEPGIVLSWSLIAVATPDDGKPGYGLRCRVARLRAEHPIEKETLMASTTAIRSPYVLRLELVRDTLMSHSKLKDQEASELAEHVLQALNSIPEKIR